MRAHTIGIIGYGGFGAFLHHAWDAMDGVAVVAVADANADGKAVGARFYNDWRALIADPDVEIVSIATPPASHAEIACEAMRAGKHVMIEKPLATTTEDAERIRAVRDDTGRVAAVNFMLRFNPVVRALQSWSRTGAFGCLRRVTVENYAQDESLAPEHWFWDPAVSGGILVEHAVHFIDVVNGCTDARASQVDGFALRRNERQEDRMLVTARYGDDLVMTQYHAFSRPNFFEETTMRFIFDLAQVEVEGWIPLSGRVKALVNARTEPLLSELPGLAVHARRSVADLQEIRGSRESPGGQRMISSGGLSYAVEHQVEAAFEMPLPKPQAYIQALQLHMADLVQAIEDPAHRLRAPVEAGIAALAIAEEGTRTAHGKR